MKGFSTKHLRLILLILASCFSFGGCGPTEEEIAREKERLITELQQDHANRMLVPSWYRRSLSYSTAGPIGYLSGRFAYAYSGLRWALAFTAVVLTFIFTWIFKFKPTDKKNQDEYLIAPFAVIPVCELAAFLIYPVVWIFTFLLVGDYYVPSGLIVSLLYVGVIVVFPVLNLYSRMGIRSEVQTAVVQGTVAAGRTKRGKIVSVAVRAFVVAIITSVGSQLGGWLGGIAAIVVSAVLASLIGVDVSSHTDSHAGNSH